MEREARDRRGGVQLPERLAGGRPEADGAVLAAGRERLAAGPPCEPRRLAGVRLPARELLPRLGVPDRHAAVGGAGGEAARVEAQYAGDGAERGQDRERAPG